MERHEATRVLAVDWGAKRIGLAVSDPSRTIAKPLTMLEHTSRNTDAARIAATAEELKCTTILMGVTYDAENNLSAAGRSAKRLAEAIRQTSNVLVELWDEEGSTQQAKHAQLELGTSKNRRRGHFDSHAAAIFLQRYLDQLT